MNLKKSRNNVVVWGLVVALWLAIFWGRGLGRTAHVGDEATTGMLATGLIDGLAAPIGYYQYNWITGNLVYGVLLYPVYRFLGPSAIWLKLLSFCFVFGGVALWTLAVRRNWGREIALVFFVWTAVAPPLLEVNYHHAYALHIESLLFSGLLLLVFRQPRVDAPGFWETAALGLTAGFAVFFSQENLAIVAAAAVAGVLRWRWRALVRLAWPGAAGFAVGYSPRLASINMPFDIPAALRTYFSGASLAHWQNLLANLFPRCACYEAFGGRWLSLAWLAVWGGGAILAAARAFAPRPSAGGRDWFAVCLTLHVVFFILAYAAAARSFPMGRTDGILLPDDVRYFVGIGLTMLALASYLLIGRGPSWRWLLVAPFLAAGFADLGREGFGLDRLSIGFADVAGQRGDDYRQFIGRTLPLSWKDKESALRSVMRLPNRWREEGCGRFGEFIAPTELDGALADVRLSPRQKLATARGAGAAFARRFKDRPLASPENADDAAARPAARDARLTQAIVEGYFYETLNRWWPYYGNRDAAIGPAFRRAVREAAGNFPPSFGPPLGPEEIRLALARAAGRWAADNIVEIYSNRDLNNDVVDQIFRYGRQFLADDEDEAPQAAYRAAFADGIAAWVMDNFLRFRFSATNLDFAAIRQSLLDQGVALRPTGRRPNEYDVVVL